VTQYIVGPPAIAFTDERVRNLEPTRDRYEVRDAKTPYLRLRVSANKRTWFVRRKLRGTRRSVRAKLGNWPEMTVNVARVRSLEAARLLSDGMNPNATWAAERVRQRLTLRMVWADYQRRKSLRPRTVQSYDSDLRNSCADWWDRPLASLSPDMVAARHETRKLASESRANGFVRVLRLLFRFANKHHQLRLPMPSEKVEWAPTRRKQSHLPPERLKQWITAVLALPDDVGARHLYGTARDALVVLAATGCRLREVLALEWSELELRQGVVTLPADRCKGKRMHCLPLGPRIRAVLAKRHKSRRSERYVFPGPDPQRPLNRISSHVLNKISIRFTPHDLRRTALTTLEGWDVSAYALQRIANHASGDVTSGYVVANVERLRPPIERLEKHLFAGKLPLR
jgi:integrase